MPEAKPNPFEVLQKRAEEASGRDVEVLITQIKEARRDVETSLTKLTLLADEMRNRTRRNTEGSTALTNFTTAHLRFAAAATQGLRRTSSLDRLLDREKANKEETQRREAQERRWAETRKAQKLVERTILPPDDGFDELYGEVVKNA